MKPPAPVHVLDLFDEERASLLDVLASLDDAGWAAPTVCEGWSVKDIAAHVIADDFGAVSSGRDGYKAAWFNGPWDELLAFINRQNETWVQAMRRLSPQLVIDLLRFSGERAFAVYRSRDLTSIGPSVDWAGPEPAPMWLHIAREYTERWLHGQQIRDALGLPGLYEPRLFAPVLATFVRALPYTYRDVPAEDGTHVRLVATGDAGGTWSIVMRDGRWQLYEFVETEPRAVLTIDQETAWRLFTRGITPDVARARVTLGGDIALGEIALRTVSIIA
jgi:uncharacterized protein (TIGR03083 family)